MKPILIYDGYCTLCISLIKMLEPLNQMADGTVMMRFVPLQHAAQEIEAFSLSPDALQNRLHVILSDGSVLAGAAAVSALGDYFPIIKTGNLLFNSALGDAVYNLIAQYRYGIFGCSDTCYISPSNDPPKEHIS